MHPDEKANWQRIKEHLEEVEQTDNWFYKRAVAIVEGANDPLPAIAEEKDS
mgnify:CR=1 FL=1